ncbi:hypothetical protein AAG570_007200 [Ranatra chinensis]|uniref:ISXO2-like transposase domain-containing protein n=1 Tax=Ranatra chinensis TaxID=642074 RepID=A0ABD0YH03_9HEMI
MLSTEGDAIGGPDKTVEIYENMFGKRKYNKCKHVEGSWVYGGVERGSNKCFFRIVGEKGKVALMNVIKSTVLPGTTVVSNLWDSYGTLKDEGFRHLTDEHSLFFESPDTGAHTTSIEGIWNALKKKIPRRTVADHFDAYLGEYLWRRHHSGDEDLMATFLEGIRRVYPPKRRDTVENGALEEENYLEPGTSHD